MLLNDNLLAPKSTLLLLIKTLKPKEWTRFKDFVDSPFFNKDERIHRLFQLLDKKYPFKDGVYKTDLLPAFGLKTKYAKGYKLSHKEDGALRKLMMRFSNLLKEYIIYEFSKNKETRRQRNLVDYLMMRKQYALIPKIIKKQTQKIEKEEVLNQAFYHDKFVMAEAEFYMLIIMNDQKNEATTQYLINSFIDYVLSTIMIYYCAAYNRETILTLSHDYPLIDSFLQYIQQNQERISPLARTYFHVFNLIKYDNSDEFFLIKQIMADHPTFDVTTQRQIYSHLLNYCSKQIRLGGFQYRTEKHSIYIKALSIKMLSSGLYFSAQHFLLIAKNALKLKHFEWAWTFIVNYKYELNPKFNSQYQLVLGHYHFYTKNYADALDCLIKINYSKDFFSILQYRVLWIQIHYENERIHDAQVDNALEAMRQYLSNEEKMSQRIKDSHYNFMKLTKRLLRWRQSIQQEKKEYVINKLKTDILETKYLDERDWLLEKVNEF